MRHPHQHSIRLLLLLLILLLGWTLRTHDLAVRSLWADEGWTMLLSAGPGVDDITLTMVEDQHPPLFFIMFRGWRDLTGESEFAARYFSVLISVIAVALAFQLGRELFDPAAGLLAALLLALADNHIDLAQEVRHYSLLATLVVLSSLYYVRWWHRPTRANQIGYVLSSIALLYTHYLGGYVLIAQLIHMVIALSGVRSWRRLGEGLSLFGAICLGFLPWFPVVIAQNSVRWDNPLYYQNALPNNLDTYRMVRDALLGQRFALILIPALLGLVYVTYPRRDQRERLRLGLRPIWPALFLTIWIGFMIGLTLFINARREFLTVRNFILVTPAILILAGHGLANVQPLARGFTVALVLVVGVTTGDVRRDYPDWRAVTRTISDHYADNEPILMDIWVGDFPARYYIDHQLGEDTPRVSLREWRDTYQALFLPTLFGYLQEIDAFWLMYWGDDPMDEYGDLIDRAGFQRTAALAVDHHGTAIHTYRYDRLTDSTIATFGDQTAEGQADLFALRRFHAPDSTAPGETITVSLWWTARQTPALDYSVSVFLLDDSGQPPLDGVVPTRTWQPGDVHYDTHKIALPRALPAGDYQLGVKVYWYGNNQPLAVSMGDQGMEDYALLGTLQVR
jgi:hypothetical protein